ncbi:MAG: AAA family ATPase, partial [Gemmatimonadaceae bacterium]
MLRLTTIGPVAIHIGDARVPTANHQVCSALLYLIVERGQPVPRRTLIDLFFPEATEEAGAHSLRQLFYRLRKLGAELDADSAMVCVPDGSASWDVDALLAKGWAGAEELRALERGYLADYGAVHSARFSEWLDQHRAHVGGKLRHLLIAQLKAERSQRRFRALENVARACLALDPLNEEATLAAAESLAMAGAKVEAVALLDNYLGEIGHRARELKIPPRILRERISDYVADADSSEKIPLVGRENELALISSIVERSAEGSPRACVVSGPSGIGKTRLLNEACSLAALSGFAIARGKLYPHDARRPFAILRDIGPALLDLPGALGASPESLAAVRGLCGRGPSQFQSVPTGVFETQAVVAELHARVLELIDAIAIEQPVVIYIEDAHWIDDASLDLLGDLMDDQRAVCMLIATQRPLQMPSRMADSLGTNEIRLPALTSDQSRTVLGSLLAQTRLPTDDGFIETATRVSGGVPFYLHVLFRHYQQTGDASTIPPGLSASLAARLDVLAEPTRSVFDAIVILGSSGSDHRLEKLTQLPRYSLLESLRTLESMGMIRVTQNSLTASHDLFAAAASTRMSPAVARLLHRGAAGVLESEATEDIEPLELASHWEACGEDGLALNVLTRSADRCLRLGRPKEAIELLLSALRVARSSDDERGVEVGLFKAYRASHLFLQADGYASKLALHSGALGGELQAGAIDNVYALG